ncbi:peptidase S8/S53 domain-containing protein [Dactylonectria macrodidyma]|uniref:Peptidase S8/S53 domain-containing protein n=1 Tax=Dactylonectria macrodidyma TaxID=307937 RepID=A0A9P9JQD6_9HYPO|nr:peptidase S8/S53 domain-containing protein [Dactylonectria macrodidyma]
MSYKSFVLAGLAAVALGLPTDTQGIVSGKFIVALEPTADVDVDLHARWVSDVHAQSLARRGGEFTGIDKMFNFPGFQGYSGSFDAETVEIIKANASVQLVEPEQIYTVASPVTQQNPQWALSALSNANPPSTSAAYAYDSTAGEGTFVYVLDSGILTTHQEFQGRAVFGQDTSGVASEKRHGTHVAAIVNGVTYGVAKKATVVDVQVLGDDYGSSTGVLSGVSWTVNDVVSKNRVGKAVINMSLGGGNSGIFNNAVQSAIDAGIPVVVAAGNLNKDAATDSPANAPNAITVAASNKNYQRWSQSNYGTICDIFAPGEAITSAYPPSTSSTYTTSGTSQAAPHVAGVIAYLFALEGPRTPAQIWTRLQQLAIKDKITDTKGVPNLFLYNGSGK